MAGYTPDMVESHVKRAQWLEIDAAALNHNVGLFRRIITRGTRFVGVVKANAYGHGIDQVVPVLEPLVDWFGVHSASEARRLRRLGVNRPILVMGFVPPGEICGLGPDDHLLISTREALDWIGDFRARTGISLPVHLKVDTGTNRQGVEVGEIGDVCRLAALRGLDIVGLATHFANIEDTLEHDFAQGQLDVFSRSIETMRRALGHDPQFIHAACSAAALLIRKADFNMVRVGISLYGHWPSRETRLSWSLAHGVGQEVLRPVATWKAVVGQIQQVGAGESVGYGRSWRALRPTRLAVIPVGYSDGYPRALGNRSRLLVKGRAVPVVGRVCMNILMADVTDLDRVEVGDDVVLLGRQDGSEVSAEELASLCDTINYELVARLPEHIPRVVVDGEAT